MLIKKFVITFYLLLKLFSLGSLPGRIVKYMEIPIIGIILIKSGGDRRAIDLIGPDKTLAVCFKRISDAVNHRCYKRFASLGHDDE